MYYGLKQVQITLNIENKYVLILIHLVAQCSKITNTVLFIKGILRHFAVFCCFLLVMSECPKVHFVALKFIHFLCYTHGQPTYIYIFIAITLDEKVQVGKDQEKAQSERDSHSKNRGGEKTKLTIRHLYHETYRKPNEQLFSQ